MTRRRLLVCLVAGGLAACGERSSSTPAESAPARARDSVRIRCDGDAGTEVATASLAAPTRLVELVGGACRGGGWKRIDARSRGGRALSLPVDRAPYDSHVAFLRAQPGEVEFGFWHGAGAASATGAPRLALPDVVDIDVRLTLPPAPGPVSRLVVEVVGRPPRPIDAALLERLPAVAELATAEDDGDEPGAAPSSRRRGAPRGFSLGDLLAEVTGDAAIARVTLYDAAGTAVALEVPADLAPGVVAGRLNRRGAIRILRRGAALPGLRDLVRVEVELAPAPAP
ncbi:MAG: hypothetical protein R2939_08945 [Kofleriaceae bacterium]